MKRLINADDVLHAKEHGEDLVIDAQTIVTPAAYDLARECGVALRESGHERQVTVSDAHSCCCKEHKHAPSQGCCCGGHREEPMLDADEVYRILKAAIDYGLWSEHELIDALKALG